MKIINASKRTDLPAFYADMLAGYCLEHKEDFFVFWTKNIIPLIKTNILDNINNWYIQYTVTSYSIDIEPNVSRKRDHVNAIKFLSNKYGKNRVVWRYDPILLNEKYTMDYHSKYFDIMANELANHVHSCTISFLDWYPNIDTNLIKIPNRLEQDILAKQLGNIANTYNLEINTCSEAGNYQDYGIGKAQCVNPNLIEEIGKIKVNHTSALQRKECGCIKAIDIGQYTHKCLHKCVYCYAKHN